MWGDLTVACGLVGCSAITFVVMFMPKGRQLSAMGRDGVYSEDRADVVYTGSSTQSTASGGTPSPSFFPIKPGKLVEQFKAAHGVDLSQDRMAAQRLQEAAEKAKIELSQVHQAQINLPFITATADGPLHLDESLSRSQDGRLTRATRANQHQIRYA